MTENAPERYLYRGIEIFERSWGYDLRARHKGDACVIGSVTFCPTGGATGPDKIVELLVANWADRLTLWDAMDRIPWALHAIPETKTRELAIGAFLREKDLNVQRP